jgi:hypothetical protein
MIFFNGWQKYLFLPEICELININLFKNEKHTDNWVSRTDRF